MLLDGEKLINNIKSEIAENESERDAAIKAGWYEKAARLHTVNQGLNRTLQLISKGDHIVREKDHVR